MRVQGSYCKRLHIYMHNWTLCTGDGKNPPGITDPVGAVGNSAYQRSAQLETAPTKYGERKCLFSHPVVKGTTQNAAMSEIVFDVVDDGVCPCCRSKFVNINGRGKPHNL